MQSLESKEKDRWLKAGNKLKGSMGVSHPPPNLENLPFAEQKRQYNEVLQGNLLDPGPFD